MNHLNPDHDAVAFALDHMEAESVLAEAIAGAAADYVGRWTLVTMAVNLWAFDRAASLVGDQRTSLETARCMAERIMENSR